MKNEQLKVQVWIFCRPNWVLLFKTTPERGGFWQPVTGSVDRGEAYEAAALREAQEETGLKFSSTLQDLGYEFTFESRWCGQARERAFALELPPPHEKQVPTLDPREHLEWKWVTAEQASLLLKFDSNREALQRLVTQLSKELPRRKK